jgi:hypothetical protein
MAMAPRPLTADTATVITAGPKANSVTMRRSKASSAFPATGGASSCGLGRGQTTAAAISSAGSANATWPTAKTSGCRM